jgi:hypothetical protein
VDVCEQVGITLPSFDTIGTSSGNRVLRVGFGVVLGIALGTALFVGGLV